MRFRNLTFILLSTLLFACNGEDPLSSNVSSSANSSNEITSEVLELPDVSTLEKTYFDYNSEYNYKTTLTNVLSIATLHFDGEYVDTKNYIYNDQTFELIIGNSFLVEKGYGKHILTINKTLHYCIVIYDEREPYLIGEPSFTYLGQKHPTFEFALFGAELTSFNHNDTSYMEYASVKDNKLIINGSLCEKFISLQYFKDQKFNVVFSQDLPTETKTFEFELSIYIPTQGGTTIK